MDGYFRETWTQLYLQKDGDINFPAHIHGEIELIYVISGGGNAFCDGTEYALNPGDIFISFPNQVHSFHDCQKGEYILLIINPSRLLYLEQVFHSRVPTSALSQGTPALVSPLLEALEEFQSREDSCVVDGYLTVFFGRLLQSLSLQRSTDMSTTVSQLLHYCTQHYREPITVADVCQALQISQSHVSHIFSKRLKITFPDYMNALRLNCALPLLREPGLGITQIVDRAGFPTIRTFNRVFRKQFGCSPSEYRANQLK